MKLHCAGDAEAGKSRERFAARQGHVNGMVRPDAGDRSADLLNRLPKAAQEIEPANGKTFAAACLSANANLLNCSWLEKPHGRIYFRSCEANVVSHACAWGANRAGPADAQDSDTLCKRPPKFGNSSTGWQNIPAYQA